ncbi:MAG: hypothetical protein GY797_19350, partial [Deltaproteobacteria bacterium]|nr:hypothetical protein [Deltaproteobacteria bacterium]
AENLSIGDRLRRSDGGMARVLAIERIALDDAQLVYNFTVRGLHTYFVLEVGVLVHNIDCLSADEYLKKYPDAALFDVRKIGFTQKYYTYYANGYVVGGNVFLLRNFKDFFLDVPPIEIFRKHPSMNRFGRKTHPTKGYFGYPNRLKNGQIYSVDNRRLATYLAADRDAIPAVWLDLAQREIWDQHGFKFSTADFGFSINAMPYQRELVPESLRLIY